MIKVISDKEKSSVFLEGDSPTLLTELTCLISTLLERENIDEGLIRIAVALGNLDNKTKDKKQEHVMLEKLIKQTREENGV